MKMSGQPSQAGKDALAQRRERENLGWLASSGVLPRKRKEIEGIDGTSTLHLQAQVFEVQEKTKSFADTDGIERGAKRSALPTDLLGPSNLGVSERDRKDKLHVKSVADRGSECYAALERKAQLYEKLARGDADDEGEQYEVDFFRKAWMDGDGGRTSRPRLEQPVDTAGLAVSATGGMLSDDMRRERERRQWEEEERRRADTEYEQEQQRRQYKKTVLEINEQTKEERDRSLQIKKKQEDAAKQKEDKLKAAFLKKMMKGAK